eukprot:TRINITY_DN4178_c0_g1_i2.p1 TRINITY_DN4178_c0_g1~~TRINITY_DN4178_c0_g1_i2.p1  ORF type:complete len:130 (+),score=29.31 TRINITY_DN4178_c0_g1_i2:12-401(+)
MTRPRVICVGLPPNSELIPVHLRPGNNPLLEKFDELMKERAPDVDFKFLPCLPDEPKEDIQKRFKKHGQVDAVVVGYGVRSQTGLTAFMEFLIEAVQEVSPKVKILFNISVESTYDAIRRAYPQPNPTD